MNNPGPPPYGGQPQQSNPPYPPQQGQPRPPYPPQPYGQHPYGYGMPPGPPKRSRTGMVLGLVGVGAVVVIGLVVVLAVVVGKAMGPSYDVYSPDHAGGFARDRHQEQQLASQLAAAQSELSGSNKVHVDHTESGVYTEGHPGGVTLVYVGAKYDGHGDPADYVRGFSESAKSQGFPVTKVSAGAHAQGVCAELGKSGVRVSACTWATSTTMVLLTDRSGKLDVDQLAAQMRKMRPDLEHKEG